MLRKRSTNERIASALRQAEIGASVDEACRKMGVNGVPETRRLKQPEDENGKRSTRTASGRSRSPT